MSDPLLLTGGALTLDDLVDVAFRGRTAVLSPDAAARIDASRAVIDRAVREDRVVYGVTTGFGKFSDVSSRARSSGSSSATSWRATPSASESSSRPPRSAR